MSNWLTHSTHHRNAAVVETSSRKLYRSGFTNVLNVDLKTHLTGKNVKNVMHYWMLRRKRKTKMLGWGMIEVGTKLEAGIMIVEVMGLEEDTTIGEVAGVEDNMHSSLSNASVEGEES